jgi:hypothetical protein
MIRLPSLEQQIIEPVEAVRIVVILVEQPAEGVALVVEPFDVALARLALADGPTARILADEQPFGLFFSS